MLIEYRVEHEPANTDFYDNALVDLTALPVEYDHSKDADVPVIFSLIA